MSERQISMMCTENVSNSIVSSDHKGPQVVCYGVDSHPEDSRFRIDGGGKAPTLTVKIAKGSADGPLVLIEDEGLRNRKPSAGQQSQDQR